MDPETGEDVESLANVAAATTKFFFSASFFVNLFLVGGLSQILSMIQNLSIIVHMQLVNVKIPATAHIFFNSLLSIVAFDIIDNSPIEDWLIDMLDVNNE